MADVYAIKNPFFIMFFSCTPFINAFEQPELGREDYGVVTCSFECLNI